MILKLFKRDKEERRSLTLRDPDGWRQVFGFSTAAGVTVTPEAAIGHPAVLGAVRLIAELTASLPLLVYERTTEGRRRAERHPVYRLLHEAPNTLQTPYTFKANISLHLLLYGNAYLLVRWNDAGRPVALWPIHPSRVQVEMDGTGTVTYKVNHQGRMTVYAGDDILHIPLLPLDGLLGRSPLQLAKEAIGAALAAEEHAAGYFANAACPSGILKTAGTLSQEAMERLKATWQAAFGRGKSGTAVLEAGYDYQPLSANAQQAQLIESRQFAMRTIAAALRIPPHLLDPTARGTYANVETQSLEFLTFSLQPFLTRIEEAFTLKLFTPSERTRYFVEFLTDSLLRADTRTRYLAYKVGIEAGFLTVNEVRQRENLPPLPDTRGAAMRPTITEEMREKLHQDKLLKHRDKIKAVARRVLAREREEVLALVEKALGRRDLALAESSLVDYYQQADWVASEFSPAFAALVREAHSDATAAVGTDPWADDTLDEFTAGLVAAYAATHARISLASLTPALRAGTDDAVLEALDQTFSEMLETRPGKTAALETSNAFNETALETYRRAGVTKIRWKANPGACDFCKKLNGKVVGIGEAFVAKGETIPGPGGDLSRKLTARRPRLRPPAHLGCLCTLEPEV